MTKTKLITAFLALFLFAGSWSLKAQNYFPPMVDDTTALNLVETELPEIYANSQTVTEKMTGYADTQRKLKVYVHLMELLKTGDDVQAAIQATFQRIGVITEVENVSNPTLMTVAYAPSVTSLPDGSLIYEYNDNLLQEIVNFLAL